MVVIRSTHHSIEETPQSQERMMYIVRYMDNDMKVDVVDAVATSVYGKLWCHMLSKNPITTMYRL